MRDDSSGIREINHSNAIMDGREELGILCKTASTTREALPC